jgi:hypothetical protein
MQGWFGIFKSINVIDHISVSAETALNKIQYPFMIKTHNKSGIEGIDLNTIKVIYDKPTANSN